MPASTLLLPSPRGFPPVLMQPLLGALNRLTGLTRLDRMYQQTRSSDGEGDFLDRALAALGVHCQIDPGQMDCIPPSGPLVVVANHPFGGVEGMALAQVLRRHRPDLRVLANHLLGRIPELDPLMIHVNPFVGAAAAQQNITRCAGR